MISGAACGDLSDHPALDWRADMPLAGRVVSPIRGCRTGLRVQVLGHSNPHNRLFLGGHRDSPAPSSTPASAHPPLAERSSAARALPPRSPLQMPCRVLVPAARLDVPGREMPPSELELKANYQLRKLDHEHQRARRRMRRGRYRSQDVSRDKQSQCRHHERSSRKARGARSEDRTADCAGNGESGDKETSRACRDAEASSHRWEHAADHEGVRAYRERSDSQHDQRAPEAREILPGRPWQVRFPRPGREGG